MREACVSGLVRDSGGHRAVPRDATKVIPEQSFPVGESDVSVGGANDPTFDSSVGCLRLRVPPLIDRPSGGDPVPANWNEKWGKTPRLWNVRE